MNVGFVGYMVIIGQGSPNSIFGSNKCQLVSFQIRKHLYWLLRQFVHWFVHERHFRILTIQMGTPPPSRFPCCVLSYFSLVFVMEHNWQIQVKRVSWVGQSTRGCIPSQNWSSVTIKSKFHKWQPLPALHNPWSKGRPNVAPSSPVHWRLWLMKTRSF